MKPCVGFDPGELVSSHGSAMWLRPRAPYVEVNRCSLGLLALHLLGLVLVARLTHEPLWLLAILVLAVQPAILSLRTRRLQPLVECLGPLLLVYIVSVWRVGLQLVFGERDPATGALIVPDPWGQLLDVRIAALLGVVWALMAQLAVTLQAFGAACRYLPQLGQVLGAAVLVWAATTYPSMRPAGVTASDPYGYTQMAVDIATHGNPIHTFVHVPELAGWGLSLWSLVPVGYNVPDMTNGASTSAWPEGYSAMLAVAYLAAGDPGLYLLTPLLAVLALAVTWWLSMEVLHDWPAAPAALAASIAVVLVATSYVQLEAALRPMADVPSQIFTVATVCLAIRAQRQRSRLLAVLAGLSLGIAFTVRYTQVFVAVPVAFVFLHAAWREVPACRRRSVELLALCAVAAWIPALPLFAYHQYAYHHPLAVGSGELALISIANLPLTGPALAEEIFRPAEFLYVLPFVLIGLASLWCDRRWLLATLALWIAATLAIHLAYLAVHDRDVLSLFPVLALGAGIGIVRTLQWLGRLSSTAGRHGAARVAWAGVWVLTMCAVVVAVYGRAGLTLVATNPDARDGFRAFGYLHAEQRHAFDTLRDLVPPNSLVATTFNAGPIELYSNRHPVRPRDWSSDEWELMLRQAFAHQRPVFMLLDGEDLERPLDVARASYQIHQVALLPAHYFSSGAGSDDSEVWLVEVTPPGVTARNAAGNVSGGVEPLGGRVPSASLLEEVRPTATWRQMRLVGRTSMMP